MRPPDKPRLNAAIGSVIGLLSVGIAVSVGELVASLVRPAAAPVTAVGNRLILLTPESVKRAAISSVGTNDKTLLLTGIYLLLAIFGAVIGHLAQRHLLVALVGVTVLAAFGVYCCLTANASQPTDVIPTLIGAIASGGVLIVLTRLARQPAVVKAGDARHGGVGRRALLISGTGTTILIAVGILAGRAAQHARFDVAAKRRAIKLPPASPPTEPAPRTDSALTPTPTPAPAPTPTPTPAPDGPDLKLSGVEPWATPNAGFYRIDTALTVPQIDPDTWTLRIHGMVEREITVTWQQLLARPMIERWITLCCVSNTVGGNLIGNALFQGAVLADVLREAGVLSGADQLLLTSADGYSFGAPTSVVMDGRDALLAIGMNGEPLPIEHGFPVRTVVPGLYGYVSACKWITEIEATTFTARRGYWVQAGWAPTGTVKLASRIDIPRTGQRVKLGQPTTIAGVAWDQHVGVSAVEVQINNAPWQSATLATVPSIDTWRQWSLPWTPTRIGTNLVKVRAIDADGNLQDAHPHAPFPTAASGLHAITVTTRD